MENIIIKNFKILKIKNIKKTFLGAHCNSYDYTARKLYDFETRTKHHWDDYSIFVKDNEYLEKLYERLLENLCFSLNKFHECKKSKLYWEILLDLGSFIFVQIFLIDENIEKLSSSENFSTEINESLKKIFDIKRHSRV